MQDEQAREPTSRAAPAQPRAPEERRATGVEPDSMGQEPAVPEGARAVRIFGTVTNQRGVPLAGVRVFTGSDRARGVQTDVDGGYKLRVILSQRKAPTLRYHLEGYALEEISLEDEDPAGERLDVEMQNLGGRSVVAGRVTSEDGEPIEGIAIQLHSKTLNARYIRMTDKKGRFSIPNVKTDTNYEFFVRPERDYRNYSKPELDTTQDDVYLEIVLERLSSGRLLGSMVDPDGYPITDFDLLLRSSQASQQAVQVSSDEEGYFVLEDAPSGDLTFTGSGLAIRGVSLSPGMEKEVVLVLDWGDHVIEGWVLDDAGRPLPGAELTLSWSGSSEGLHSGSARRSVSDESGAFRFSNLGPKPHRVTVRANGYRALQETLEVVEQSGAVELRLEPLPQ